MVTSSRSAKRGQSLLEAVIARPDDDAPRLAYAAWVARTGDVDRARFIRLQCESDKLPPDSPRAADLRGEELALLTKHGWRWAKEVGRSIDQWVYRRGFIERVQMGLEVPAGQIITVMKKAPIRHIRDITQFCHFNGVVEALPHLHRLTGLEFWYLYAFDNALVEKMLTSRHLRNLRTLIMHHDRNGNMVRDRVMVRAMQSPHRRNLVELGVNIDGVWRGPSTRVIRAMCSSPYLRKLRKLNLTHAGDKGNHPAMDVNTIKRIGASPNFQKLESLDLGDASFTDAAWKEALKWPWLPRLKHLRLCGARQVKKPDVFFTVTDLADAPKYRNAFEERVAAIDWETEFISPWDGNTCWKGDSWDDQSRVQIADMQPFAKAGELDRLESRFRSYCREHGGAGALAEVDALPMDSYEKRLGGALRRALATAKRSCKSICFRLWAVPNWKSSVLLQRSDFDISTPYYEDVGEQPPLHTIDGPLLSAAARIHRDFPLQDTTEPSGPGIYLVARIVASLCRCLAQHPSSVPVYFSCIGVGFRVTEGSHASR